MSLFKRKSKDTGNDVYAFISGNTIPITEVNDPVFSAKTLGVAEGSNHAVGMTLANGAEILIHVGLDTVSLNGKGFKILVKEGQKVKPGTKLLKFDKSFIESEGFDTACVFVLTNCEDFPDVRFFTGRDVVQNETVICKYNSQLLLYL